jgi:hypothetical protein
MNLLKRLLDLDDLVKDVGMNIEMSLELETIVDSILQIEDFDKTKLDADNLYVCNQLGVLSYNTFAVTLEDAIVNLSQYLHPLPDDNMLF